MFSQCEDINCRSLAPLQDTPSVKATYGACVTTENPLVPYMSANISSVVPVVSTNSTITCFHMDIPIASYLIAISIGNIQYQSLGNRVGVLTEPELMESAIHQFASLGQMLSAAETYVGIPYIWGVYNILVLPPSFPYGGMENPLMTFYNSALITGNKALLPTAVHEICHSWTGNQVTMNNWQDFWLNEGFTTFI